MILPRLVVAWGGSRHWLLLSTRPQNHKCLSCGQKWQVGGRVYFKVPLPGWLWKEAA